MAVAMLTLRIPQPPRWAMALAYLAVLLRVPPSAVAWALIKTVCRPQFEGH